MGGEVFATAQLARGRQGRAGVPAPLRRSVSEAGPHLAEHLGFAEDDRVEAGRDFGQVAKRVQAATVDVAIVYGAPRAAAIEHFDPLTGGDTDRERVAGDGFVDGRKVAPEHRSNGPAAQLKIFQNYQIPGLGEPYR